MQSPAPDPNKQPEILGRTRRLTPQHRITFDQIFHSGGGYVLNFSDRTMGEWFEEFFDFNIFDERYQIEGDSKGKTLRGFIEVAEPRLVARVLRALWDYRCSLDGFVEDNSDQETRLKMWLEQFTNELENSSSLNLDEAFKDFSSDTTLPKLRASIAGDLIGNKPDVALDRIHTYCVKRFRALLADRGMPCDPSTPLHAIFGAYGKAVRDEGVVSQFALPTLRVQHKLFEGLNDARNKRSFAHDNDLLAVSEARFIVDCVLASLSFIERIEADRDSANTTSDNEIPF